MRESEIIEGHCYTNDRVGASYFRCARLIVPAADRPGGKVVAWDTDGFDVLLDSNGKAPLKRHGRCGIATFAAWASRDITATGATTAPAGKD